MTRLPLTVVSGYLGAGKTTLINRVLAENHGRKLLVMVNDFGAINIDASLLVSADEDTLVLSNGCVCCTMGADLFMAIGDVLDRRPRPDHLLIEASGIADPARIAMVAQTEPDLIYAGIATVVDAQTWRGLSRDDKIGPQILQQAAAADVLFVSKQSKGEVLDLPGIDATQFNLADVTDVAPVLLGVQGREVPQTAPGHAAHVSWHISDETTLTRQALLARLGSRPAGLFRVKGFVGHDATSGWEVHCVGQTVSVKPLRRAVRTQVVGIGLAARISVEEIAQWWANTPAK